jgi:hypothetical protein
MALSTQINRHSSRKHYKSSSISKNLCNLVFKFATVKDVFYKFLIILASILLGVITNLSAQCKSNLDEFNQYFSQNKLRLDAIEGVWKVSRTTKLYSGEYLRHIQKFNESETWIITKNANKFITCYPDQKNTDYNFEWIKEQNSRYQLIKTYKNTSGKSMSIAALKPTKIVFSLTENDDFLKLSLGEKYQNGMTVTHDYELTKMEDYFDKVTNQIPVVKHWIMDGVKSYLNKIF